MSFPKKALVLTALLSVLHLGAHASAAPVCSKPNVAFRLDDIQDHWLSNSQKAVIRLFSEDRLPLTLGIIGGFFGEDRALVNEIKARLEHIEIANHGFHAKNSRDGKSILLSQSTDLIERQIRASSEKIENLLGVPPTVFIPHKNQFDSDVMEALSSLRFGYISSACYWHLDRSSVCEDPCGYSGQKSCTHPDHYGLVHLPVGASTQWEPSPGKGSAEPGAVLAEIRMATAEYGFAVVMLHPQDFVRPDKSLAPSALAALDDLLSRLRVGENYNVVPLSQVSRACQRGP